MAMDIGSAMFELGGGNPTSDTPHASRAVRWHQQMGPPGAGEPQGPSIAEMEAELRALVVKLESVMSRQPANAQMADQQRREVEALKARIEYLKEMISRADAQAQEAAERRQQEMANRSMGTSSTGGGGGLNQSRITRSPMGVRQGIMINP